ncbi:MAG: radical SAM protein [Candidatus Saganbacteria bacterium]|nr:radical SAM protein [Candidatus Saganbacteria bacterium]
MRVVRLTDFGNRAINNFQSLPRVYGRFAEAKREKLEKLWPSNESMSSFEETFNQYPGVTGTVRSFEGDADLFLNEWEDMGLIELQRTTKPMDQIAAEMKEAAKNSPIRFVGSVVVELTGLCNLNCKGCYRNGSSRGEFGLPVDKIKEALKPLLMAGVTNISFTGGEASLRMDDLFELIDFVSDYMLLREPNRVTLMQMSEEERPTVEDLKASDRYVELWESEIRIAMGHMKKSREEAEKVAARTTDKWVDDQLSVLNQHFVPDSVTVMSNGTFSEPEKVIKRLQGIGNVELYVTLPSYKPELADEYSGGKNIFSSVMDIVSAAKRLYFPKLYIMAHEVGLSNQESKEFRHLVRGASLRVGRWMWQLGNAIRNKMDCQDGNDEAGKYYFGDLSPNNPPDHGWCKGFIRPAVLRILPNGNISNCIHGHALPEGFGNINGDKKENSMPWILNHIQDSLPFKLFREGEIERMQHLVDKDIFSGPFARSCESIMITLNVAERFYLYKDSMSDDEALERANKETADAYGFPRP